MTIVYGDKWLSVIPLMHWAMALALTGAISLTVYKLLLGGQHARLCLILDAMSLAGTTVVLLLLLIDGLLGYMRALFMLQAALAALGLFWLCRRALLDVGAVFQSIGIPVVAAAVALIAFEAGLYWTSESLHGAVSYFFAVSLFSIGYLAVLRIAFTELLDELLGYLPLQATTRRLLVLRRG